MFRIRHLFRRSPLKLGYIDESSGSTTPVRNAQFVSFFAATDCPRRRHVDAYDLRLRRQKGMKYLAIVGIVTLFVWFVVESAHALSTF